MTDQYIPGVWSKRYEQLSTPQRDYVSGEADRRFRARTGISRKLDPKADHNLVVQWLRIRDEVLAQLVGKGADPNKTGDGLALWLPAPMKNFAFFLLYNYDVGSDAPKALHLKAIDGVMRLFIKAHAELRIGVEGHASRTGGESYDNNGLSERRAANIDKYLRKLAGSSAKFFTSGGSGAKQQVSANPFYRDSWPHLESLDEDERDRSVVVTFQWQPPGVLDALDQPNIDWDKAFDQAAPYAAFAYVSTMGLKIASDNLSPIQLGGVPVPWNPYTGWPTSWTTGNPDADQVMQAMGKMMIDNIEAAAARKGYKITRDDIIGHYQDWLKNPKNKWVNP
ncbi:OmpA family protein [Labrys neptuniae]|uniref:OmpA family protein n=1 Tax=Labrys neptuniae TaxID=376174 RepID=A0ABV3PVF4_9HYPH